MGFAISMRGFAACVLGGMGHIDGAIIGGLVLGMVENLGIWFLAGGDARWKTSFAYVALFLILMVKPAGISGTRGEAKAL